MFVRLISTRFSQINNSVSLSPSRKIAEDEGSVHPKTQTEVPEHLNWTVDLKMYDSRERGSFFKLPNPSFLPLSFYTTLGT